MSIRLRQYQEKGVKEIRAALSSGFRAPCFVSPTGSGKTVTFSYIADNSQQKGKRVTIMVHRGELIRQICLALLGFDVGYGLIQSGKTQQPDKLTQVASVQTLVNRLEKLPKPDLIIIDECAHATAGSYKKILEFYKDVPRIGVTATPQRLDGNGLGTVFDTLILGPTVQELIDQGFLSKPVYFCPPTGIDLSHVHMLGGDYRNDEIEAIMDKPKITGSAVEHYTKMSPGKPALAFCTSIKHAIHVKEQFCQAGYRAEIIEGKMDDKERARIVRDLGNGKIQVLVSVDLISEGFDCPVVHTIILLRPTQSLSLHLQQLGRGLRIYPGKTKALILDHVGNCLRHGLAETPREWSLEGKSAGGRKKPNASTVAIRQCEKCFCVHVPAPKCPQCGNVYIADGRTVDEVAGDLVELTAAEIEGARQRREAKDNDERQKLERIAKERGYKPTWVDHILDARRAKRGIPA